MRGIQIKSKAMTIEAGYNPNFDGATLANRDVCSGHIVREDGEVLFICIDQNGAEYETNEMPCIRFGT